MIRFESSITFFLCPISTSVPSLFSNIKLNYFNFTFLDFVFLIYVFHVIIARVLDC